MPTKIIFVVIAFVATAASTDETFCTDSSCASGEEASLLQKVGVKQHMFNSQPFGQPVADGPMVPDGSQLARQNAVSERNNGGQCPPQYEYGTVWSVPPDGSGLGYMILDKEIQGIQGPPFETCTVCPTCRHKQQTIYDGLLQNYAGTLEQQNSTLLRKFLSPELKWSVIGYGATSHGCFGHTFVNLSEANNHCYGFGARIADIFRPNTIEDIVIDSCGKKAMVRLFCGNCTDRPGRTFTDYPQRYQWTFNIEDTDASEVGFFITKLDALLDTEVTMDVSIAEYDVDPYVCSLLKPASAYKGVQPEPWINRLNQPSMPVTNCKSCSNCSSTMEVLAPAVESFVNGCYEPLQELLADDVYWMVPGQGSTLAACAAAQYQDKNAPFASPSGFFFRLKEMTSLSKVAKYDMALDYCGQTANFIWWNEYVGKASGFTYTFPMSLAITMKPSDKKGFEITQVIQGMDTEVFMNMGVHEQKYDPAQCDKIGLWAADVSHTWLQPIR